MNNSLKLQILSAIFFLCGTSVMAQTNLSGRTYYNANIMAEDLNATTKDIDKKIADARVKAYAKIEQKKGRKPNEKEKAAIEKELQKAAEVSKAVKNGGITIKIKYLVLIRTAFWLNTTGITGISCSRSSSALWSRNAFCLV